MANRNPIPFLPLLQVVPEPRPNIAGVSYVDNFFVVEQKVKGGLLWFVTHIAAIKQTHFFNVKKFRSLMHMVNHGLNFRVKNFFL